MGAETDFIVLTDSTSGGKTYLQKKQILAIFPTMYGVGGALHDGSEIVYDSGRSVVVRETTEEVAKLL